MSPAGCGNAPAPGEGGAATQVRQVQSLGSGVSQAAGSDCSLASTDTTKGALGLRIQLWEAGFVTQTLPRRKAMDEVRRVGLDVVFSVYDLPGLVPPSTELGGKATYAPRLLERNEHVLCWCGTLILTLLPGKVGLKQCPGPLRGEGGMRPLEMVA